MYLRLFYLSALIVVLLGTVGGITVGNSAAWGALQVENEGTATETVEPQASPGLIDFARDVRPILTAKCIECHGPGEAKNDFRVDEADSLLAYIEPGDVAGSSLWMDYLITDDEDMRMPPLSAEHDRDLTAAELATIKLWIEEGGMWNVLAEESVQAPEVIPASLAERVWHFQGLFHPATVHFPIALLTVSAGFVFLSFFRPVTCGAVAFHCLWIGALGAVVASAAGWSYAAHEGYGSGFSFDLFNSSIDRHRWLGVAVAVLSLILIPVAISAQRTERFGMRLIWLVGSLLLMAAVGITGFQGGELTYGEGHYEQEFFKLFPEAFNPTKVIDAEEQVLQESLDEKVDEKAAEAKVVEVIEVEIESIPPAVPEQPEVNAAATPPTQAVPSSPSPADIDASAEPSSAEPSSAEPSSAEPSSAEPSSAEPSSAASEPPPVVQPPALDQ